MPAFPRIGSTRAVAVLFVALGLIAAAQPAMAAATEEASAAGQADGATKTALFTPGDAGYPTFRMEALAVTNQGTILAFTEGRKGGNGVWGDVDLLLRRSIDGGKTWRPIQVAVDAGPNTVCYPSPLVDRTTGRIWLAMGRYRAPADQGTISREEPPDTSHVWICHSDDDGATWSAPIDITDHAKPPGTTWHGVGAGYGIQLRSGRLVYPCYHFRAAPHDRGRRHESSVFYSDDHGRTWKLGGIVNRYAPETEVDAEMTKEERFRAGRGWMIPGRTDEAQVVELVDGRLLINMRSYHFAYRRAISHSEDGGLSWSPVTLDEALFEPVCSGSIARLTSTLDGYRRNRILFAGPNGRRPAGHRFIREQLTLHLSYDEGKTWPVEKVLEPGFAGNLNMLALPDKRIAVLYESGENYRETIYFASCTLEWLADGKDRLERDELQAED